MVATGETIAVLSLTNYWSCMSCTGTVRSINDVLGKCVKCDATIKLSKCNDSKSARIVVSGNDKKWYLTAYNEHLEALVEGEQGSSLEEKLLNTNNITLHYYSSTNVIQEVEKNTDK